MISFGKKAFKCAVIQFCLLNAVENIYALVFEEAVVKLSGFSEFSGVL
tara:strand:- start:873 stop:1016 length:144 start_codon:yes stop_codon:yes gene_type:complete